jgi:hypothetical protein
MAFRLAPSTYLQLKAAQLILALLRNDLWNEKIAKPFATSTNE